MKKAQVSTFILVGVIILIFVSFFTLIFSLTSDDAGLDTTKLEQANVDELRASMQFCLERESELAIYNLGLQGGNIYSHQGGFDELTQTLPYILGNETKRVRYGIVRSENEPFAPFYPAAIASQQGNYYTLSFLETYFPDQQIWGKNVLRKLCDSSGPNSVDNPDKRLSCEIFTYGDTDSIQVMLQESIKKNLDLCVELQQNDFNERIGGFEYNVTSVEIIIGNDEVLVNALTQVQVAQEQITSKFNTLTYTVPVRLKRVYNLLYYTLLKETTDVNFDKSVDYIDVVECNYPGSSNCWDEGMVVSIYRSPSPESGGADILEVVDTNSNVLGNPFRYLVAIENRRPMLEFYDGDWEDAVPNLVLEAGTSANITPIGYDPDEDELTFRYSHNTGWLDANSLELSSAYISGDGCRSTKTCASLTSNKTGAYTFEIRVDDENNLYDYQDVFVKSYGSGSLLGGWYQDIDICPSFLNGYKTKICEDASCTCEPGEYCIDARPEESTQITCKAGSYCCSTKTSGSLTMDCSEDGEKFCDVKKSNSAGSIDIDCSGEDSQCRVESSSLITRNCEGDGVVCEMSPTAQPASCTSVTATCISFTSWS